MDKQTSKANVKKAFTNARELMRYIERNLDADEYGEASDLGQAILELIAEVTVADMYNQQKAKGQK